MKIPFSVYDFFGYLASGFLLLCVVDYAFDGQWILREHIWPVYMVFWAGFCYVLGQIIASLSSFLLEHKFLRGVLISPEVTLFDSEPRDVCWAWVFPIFYKPFPRETQKRVLDKARAAGIDKPGRGLFFHCHPTVMREKQTLERLNSFLKVYGFARNISTVSFLAVPILIAGMVTRGFQGQKAWWCVISAAVAIGMLYRYLKFFKHYTEEVFRTYAELPAEQKPTAAI